MFFIKIRVIRLVRFHKKIGVDFLLFLIKNRFVLFFIKNRIISLVYLFSKIKEKN